MEEEQHRDAKSNDDHLFLKDTIAEETLSIASPMKQSGVVYY